VKHLIFTLTLAASGCVYDMADVGNTTALSEGCIPTGGAGAGHVNPDCVDENGNLPCATALTKPIRRVGEISVVPPNYQIAGLTAAQMGRFNPPCLEEDWELVCYGINALIAPYLNPANLFLASSYIPPGKDRCYGDRECRMGLGGVAFTYVIPGAGELESHMTVGSRVVLRRGADANALRRDLQHDIETCLENADFGHFGGGQWEMNWMFQSRTAERKYATALCITQAIADASAWRDEAGTDPDGDHWGNDCDNCLQTANISQANYDGDRLGDACDPDDDNDGWTDVQEREEGTNPRRVDTDGDGRRDPSDNCPTYRNPRQEDTDGDGEGDECDLDRDGNGDPDPCVVQRPSDAAWVVGHAALGDGAALVDNPYYRNPHIKCDTNNLIPNLTALPDLSIQGFYDLFIDPASPVWETCYGSLDAEGGIISRGDPDNVHCGWYSTQDREEAFNVDSYFVPVDEIEFAQRQALRGPDGPIDPGTKEYVDETIRRIQRANPNRRVHHPDSLPRRQISHEWKSSTRKRRGLWEKMGPLRRLGWWTALPEAFNAAKVGFTYESVVGAMWQQQITSDVISEACGVYTPNWHYQLTDIEFGPPEDYNPFKPPRVTSVGTQDRYLDHHYWSPICNMDPVARANLPDPPHLIHIANNQVPDWPFPHNKCVCEPPVGVETKCYDTLSDRSWGQVYNFWSQIEDERRVMATTQEEAERVYSCYHENFGLAPIAPQLGWDWAGCYGGYEEGKRPPWMDTQGPGRFTVLHCMEPPGWAKAVYSAMSLPRVETNRDTYNAGWAVYPEFGKSSHSDPTYDVTVDHLDYSQLNDLYVTWPLFDMRGMWDVTVPESIVAGVAALAELYHQTPVNRRAPVQAMVNEIYLWLRVMPIAGIPRDIASGAAQPQGVDWIYDLFIGGSE
jgi:hypothetical protein